MQDLTLVETAVVIELCLAIARRRGHAPWLLAAGDDGQTVRPSGFDWGALNDLLAARLGAPRRFHLEDNLRFPSRIAAVIERASEWYVHLDKARRPTKQRHRQGGQHVDAHLLHVVADVPTAIGLLERLDEVEGLVVITVGEEKPVWLPERLRDMALTPADAKDSSTSRWTRDGCWRAWRTPPARWPHTRRRRYGSTSTALPSTSSVWRSAAPPRRAPSSTWPATTPRTR